MHRVLKQICRVTYRESGSLISLNKLLGRPVTPGKSHHTADDRTELAPVHQARDRRGREERELLDSVGRHGRHRQHLGPDISARWINSAVSATIHPAMNTNPSSQSSTMGCGRHPSRYGRRSSRKRMLTQSKRGFPNHQSPSSCEVTAISRYSLRRSQSDRFVNRRGSEASQKRLPGAVNGAGRVSLSVLKARIVGIEHRSRPAKLASAALRGLALRRLTSTSSHPAC